MSAAVFVDVDGVLVPLRSLTGDPAWGAWAPESVSALGVVGVSALQLHAVGKLPAQLVWATDWVDDANDVLGARVGRGHLPVCHRRAGRQDSLISGRPGQKVGSWRQHLHTSKPIPPG